MGTKTDLNLSILPKINLDFRRVVVTPKRDIVLFGGFLEEGSRVVIWNSKIIPLHWHRSAEGIWTPEEMSTGGKPEKFICVCGLKIDVPPQGLTLDEIGTFYQKNKCNAA